MHKYLAEKIIELMNHKEAIKKWRDKKWLAFCKELIKQDSRFTIKCDSDRSIFTKSVTLTRDGEYADIEIIPNSEAFSFRIDSGSRYNKATINAFPSKDLIWPLVSLSNVLERQFSFEVEKEMAKHGQFIIKKKNRTGKRK